jgi:hypothetical protein
MSLRDKIIELLANIYNAVDWTKMRGRYPVDVFSHRVVACSTRPTLREAISTLCNFFGLQSMPPEALMLLKELEVDEALVLQELYNSGIYYATAASVRAKALRGLRLLKEEKR